MVQLQQALVRAIGRTRPGDAEVTVLLRHERDESFEADGVRAFAVPPTAYLRQPAVEDAEAFKVRLPRRCVVLRGHASLFLLITIIHM